MYKLLIVDDEAIERDALKYILERSDLPIGAVEEAVNGQEAISIAAIFEPDIIVMDIKMPGLDGIESSKIIKKIREETKIILLTAFDEFGHAQEAIKIGVEDFVVKPATNERILEVIGNAIKAVEKDQALKASRTQIDDRLEQVSKYLKAEFLSSVISGDLNEEQLKEYVDFMNITGTCGFGVVVMLHYDETARLTDFRKQMLKKHIIESLKKQMDQVNRNYYLSHGKDMIYILVLDDKAEGAFYYQDKVKAVISEVGEVVQLEDDVNIDFGIGDVKTNIRDLWQSFSMAKDACNKKVYSKIDQPQKNMLHLLVRCIVECNDVLLNDKLNTLYHDITANVSDLEVLKVRLYEFLILFRQAVNDEVPIVLESSEVLFSRLVKIKTMGGIRVFLKDYIHHVFNMVKHHKTDKTVVIMDKLITYINNHYSENITLEDLSDLSGFSTTYLSKVFKRHVDMNFSDYLSFIRIKVAKRLLKNPTKSVKEISMEVGYVDPNYFARVFRKYEHMTPTEYRNKNIVI